MAVAKKDLTVYQGADYAHQFYYRDAAGNPIVLTGYSARMQIREKITNSATIFEATTATSNLVIDGSAGKITLTIPDTDSTTWSARKAVYDLEIVSPAGTVTRIIEGKVRIDPEVTR